MVRKIGTLIWINNYRMTASYAWFWMGGAEKTTSLQLKWFGQMTWRLNVSRSTASLDCHCQTKASVCSAPLRTGVTCLRMQPSEVIPELQSLDRLGRQGDMVDGVIKLSGRWKAQVLLLAFQVTDTCTRYAVVPKGLTFLGSLYKKSAKTTSGTLVYRFERQTARKKILPSKNTVFST